MITKVVFIIGLLSIALWVTHQHDSHKIYLPQIHGALNAEVNQGNIDSTICDPGWTSTVRPSESYTENLKFKQIDTQYRYSDSRVSDYEEDHLIPLELGGSPSSSNNLWPEPRFNGQSQRGDSEENHLRWEVCSGQITLQEARSIIVKWKTTRG